MVRPFRAFLSGVGAAVLTTALVVASCASSCLPNSPSDNNNNNNNSAASSTCQVGQVDCADGKCCAAGYGCCGIYSGREVCCPDGSPHYCRSTNLCYPYFTGAQAACGTSYVICGGSVVR